MKKIVAALVSLSLMFSMVGASFSDISSPDVNRTAAALQALEIMQGDGNGAFSPYRTLTRGEFVKIVVLALGVQDVSPYRNYTVFPDVTSAHWAAGYVNAAVKNTELSKVRIVRGDADGTFRPEGQVTLAEACTMLLRMLGYEESDIGPVWPANYISRADSLGILNGVTVSVAGANISRANAAVMLQNALFAEKKGGGTLLANLSGASVMEDCVLLATEDTDDSLSSGQISIYQKGNISTMFSVVKLDSTLVGVRGALVFDRKQTSKVKSIIPDNAGAESVTIKSIDSTHLVTENGSITVGRKIPVVSNGQVHAYNEAWFDFKAGNLITLYYDDAHALEMIAKTDSTTAGKSFVYGIEGTPGIPTGWSIERNGVVIERNQLKKYDVITFDGSKKCVLVSDAKVSGTYNEASPSFKAPESVTLLGRKFHIPSDVSASFATLKQGESITLLLDVSEKVVAVYQRNVVSADNRGIVVSVDSGKATVRLFGGITVSGSATNAADLLGKQVSVGTGADGTFYMYEYSSSNKIWGQWDVAAGTIGKTKVSPTVLIYEQLTENAPMAAISRSDITANKIDSSKIQQTILDSSGSIICIILNGATGEGVFYGMPVYSGTDGTVTVRGIENGEKTSRTFLIADKPSNLGGVPIGIPRNQSTGTGWESVTVLKTTALGSVSRDAFDGYKGVTVNGNYFELVEDVPVFIANSNDTITLRQAKADFNRFTLYANDTYENGGKVRAIVVSQ